MACDRFVFAMMRLLLCCADWMKLDDEVEWLQGSSRVARQDQSQVSGTCLREGASTRCTWPDTACNHAAFPHIGESSLGRWSFSEESKVNGTYRSTLTQYQVRYSALC